MRLGALAFGAAFAAGTPTFGQGLAQGPAQGSVASSQSLSQQAGLPPALLPLLNTAEHRAALLQAARAVDPPGTPACPDASYATTGEIGILVPLKLDSQGKVSEGAWKETIRSTGCGEPRLLNAMTQVGPGGALETTALLPGTTIADPQLQRDSVKYAATGMGSMPPGCDRGGIYDTKFLGVDGQPPGTKPVAGAAPQPWSELWTLQACAKRATVTMHFVPDATGTEIHATPAAVPG